jgi:hypothetical protein
MEINKIWYVSYAIGQDFKRILHNFLRSGIPSWCMLKIARWDEDTTSHDPLRMRITDLTQHNPTKPIHNWYPSVRI